MIRILCAKGTEAFLMRALCDLQTNYLFYKMVLKGDIGKRLKVVFEEIIERYEFEVDTMEVRDDHVHFFECSSEVSTGTGCADVKSISVKIVFEELPRIEKRQWEGEFCRKGYFIRSLGDKVTSEVIMGSIK
jgi:REP element-mobilizing transposase RayT